MIFGIHRSNSSSLRSRSRCAADQGLVVEGAHCKDGRAWAIPLHQNHKARAGRCQVKELGATRAALEQARVNLQKQHLLRAAQRRRRGSRRGYGEDQTAQLRAPLPTQAANHLHAWAHMTATTAMEAQAVRVVEEGGSRARQACRRTHRGWVMTIHTALATIEARHNGGRLVVVDALACRADRVCAEESWYRTDQAIGSFNGSVCRA